MMYSGVFFFQNSVFFSLFLGVCVRDSFETFSFVICSILCVVVVVVWLIFAPLVLFFASFHERQIHFLPNAFALIHHRTLPHYNLSFDCIMRIYVIVVDGDSCGSGGGGGDFSLSLSLSSCLFNNVVNAIRLCIFFLTLISSSSNSILVRVLFASLLWERIPQFLVSSTLSLAVASILNFKFGWCWYLCSTHNG